MGLLQNYANQNSQLLKYISSGVAATAAAHRDRNRWNIPAQFANQFITEADVYDPDGKSQLQKAGVPYGYGPPYQFVMPIKTGSMLANQSITGTGATTVTLTKGGNIASASPRIQGIGSLLANAFLGYYCQTDASGEGTITTSLTQGINLHPDTLRGAGDIDAFQSILIWCRITLDGEGDVIANLKAAATLHSDTSGSGEITVARLSALSSLLSNITGESILAFSMNGPSQLIASLIGEGALVSPQLNILIGCQSLIDGTGILEGIMKLPAGLAVSISGEGDLVSTMRGLASLLVVLEGDSSIDVDLKAIAQLAGDISGEGELINPLLKGIAWCVAEILAQGTVTSSLRSDGYMSADITSAGTLVTAQSCAVAVWSALAAAYNEDNTMGKIMNSIGAGADPWDTLMEDYTDDAKFGAYIKQLLTKLDFLTLK
jgi:hypothetical protein